VCEDDACALFGSCNFVTITNSSFSTRWSVFRFIGGNPENITVSNCLIYETYGCPIKMQFWRDSRVQNLSFSNLILRDVTGPISINLNAQPRSSGAANEPRPNGFVRNITFNGIQARVVAVRGQYPDMPFRSGHSAGEERQCIVLNCVGDSAIENVVLNDVHAIYDGGGTAEEAEREVPQVADEYFRIGTPPAYGLYARNVRGLTLNNVRFEVEKTDLRPAVVFDHVTDVAANGVTAQGNQQAVSLLRFVATRETLLTAMRVLTRAAVFLQVEDAASEGIIVDGGDLSKAATPLAFKAGATEQAVKLRT
jgi:polygalacturonase